MSAAWQRLFEQLEVSFCHSESPLVDRSQQRSPQGCALDWLFALRGLYFGYEEFLQRCYFIVSICHLLLQPLLKLITFAQASILKAQVKSCELYQETNLAMATKQHDGYVPVFLDPRYENRYRGYNSDLPSRQLYSCSQITFFICLICLCYGQQREALHSMTRESAKATKTQPHLSVQLPLMSGPKRCFCVKVLPYRACCFALCRWTRHIAVAA